MPARSVDRLPDQVRPGVPGDGDGLVAAASEVIGGRLGRHAAVRRLRWGGSGPRAQVLVVASRPVAAVSALVAAVMVGLGVLQKSYCLTRGWGGSEVFWHACYSDLPRYYVTSGLLTGSLPYTDGAASLPQPVGTGLVLWLLAQLVPVGPHQTTWFVGMWAVAAAAMAAALAAVTVSTLRRDPWRAAQVALSPLLVTVALVAPDLIGVLAVSVGLWLWSRERLGWAGFVFGLALTARSYTALVVIVLVLVAARAGVVRPAARMAGIAVLTWLAVLSAVGVVAGTSVLTAYESWLAAGSEFGAPVYLLQLAGVELPLGVLTAWAIAGWIVAILCGVVLTFLPARRPMLAQVLLVVLVVALLTGKSIPVQATLLLVPIVALARVPWRVVLLWWAAEVAYFVAVWLYLGGQDDTQRALGAGWYAVFLVVRCAALAGLAYVAARAAIRPADPRHDAALAVVLRHSDDPQESDALRPLDPIRPWERDDDRSGQARSDRGDDRSGDRGDDRGDDDLELAGWHGLDEDFEGSFAARFAADLADDPEGRGADGTHGGDVEAGDPSDLDDFGDSIRERIQASRRDPDDLAGPAAGRPDALVATFG